MNADGADSDGGSRLERSFSSGGSKRGRRFGEDFGRDDVGEDDNDYSTTCCGPGDSGGGGGGSGEGRGSESAPSIGRAKHGKEAVTGEGRAELIRRRNCENARKARARKKMEVNQLQDQVAKLKQLHAKSRVEARKAKELSTRTEVLRRQTLKTFMKYRCQNVKSYQQWAEIVHERFTMTLPITPYRWFNGQDVYNNSRILRGIEHLMTDNGSLAVLIESLGCGTLPWRLEMDKGKGHGVELVSDIADNDIIMTHNTAMCSFMLRTTNAIEHGANREWVCRGMLSAKFSPGSPKLLAAEHVFDVTSLMQHLQKVIGDDKEMPIVPNTPGGACLPSNEARVIMTATPPYTIVRCNESWTKLCGHTQEAVQGQTLKAIQGPRTDPAELAALSKEIQRGRLASSLLRNYKKDGSTFLNYLRVYPLIGDARGTITHLLGVLQEQAEPDGPTQPQREATPTPPPLGGETGMEVGARMQRQDASAVPDADALDATPQPAGGAAYVAAPKVEAKEEELPSATTNPWRGRRMFGSGAPSSSRLRGPSSSTPTPHERLYAGNQVHPKQEAQEDGGLSMRGTGMSLSPPVDPRCGPPHEEGGGIGMERGGARSAEDEAETVAGAFLSWEDVLAGSPDPALDEGGGSLGEVGANAQEEGLAVMGMGMEMEGLVGSMGMVAPVASTTTSAAGRFPDGPGDLFRIRSLSDPAVSLDGSGLESPWKLARIGSTLDLGRLAEDPADGSRIKQGGADSGAEAGGGSSGRGGGRGEGVGKRGGQSLREPAAQSDDLGERGSRSVSDSAAFGGPAPQWGLPTDSAGWDLLLPRRCTAAGAVAAGDSGNGGEGLPSGAGVGVGTTQGQQGQALPLSLSSSLSKSLPTEDGEMPVSLSGVDLSGLLLTPEELFGAPSGGGGAGGAGAASGTGDLSNTNLQALSMFNPTLLRNFACGSGSGGNDLAGLGYPAAAAGDAAGVGIGRLRSGDWTSATPYGLVTGEAGAAASSDPATGAKPRAQQPKGAGGGTGSGRDGAPVPAETSVSALDLYMGNGSLNRFQAGGEGAGAGTRARVESFQGNGDGIFLAHDG